MNLKENKNLISIDELIERAKRLGVDFGKGDPRNRLRYYTKIGLLPHAQRKSFNGLPPNGAYPVDIINILLEIDKKIKKGKSVQAIKRELELEKEKKEEFSIKKIPVVSLPYPEVYPSFKEVETEKEDFFLKPFNLEQSIGKEEIKTRKKSFLMKIFGFFFVLIILTIANIALSSWLTKKNLFSYFFASFQSVFRLAQQTEPIQQSTLIPPTEESFSILSPEIFSEPYLTINAETDINGPLNVKEKITTPLIFLTKEKFKGSLSVATLSFDRDYIFPDQSGTVCLTTGNCVGLGGEIFGVGGIANRLAKFISPTRIGNSSISDFYNGVALTIDTAGRVGIGTATPRASLEVRGDFLTPNFFVSGGTDGRVGIKIIDPKYDLHIKGRIQATGDICTDLEGEKCLSKLTEGGNVYISGGGVSGVGSAGYLSLWTGNTILGNSIVFQSGDILSVRGNLELSRNLNVMGNAIVSGTTTMADFVLTTGASEGYILTSDSFGRGRWMPAPVGTIPEGELGYTLRHNGTNWVADDFLYNSGSLIGIGTSSPNQTLSIVGSSSFDILGIYNSFVQPVLYLTSLGNVGIGTTTPSATLSIAGSLLVTASTTFNGISYTWPSSAGSNGYVLTTDGSGVLSWTSAGGISGSGTQYYIPRWAGTMVLENSILYSNDNFLGIGTTSELAKLTVAGSGYFLGPLTLGTSSLPQLVLKYDDNNYLNFAVDSDSSTILASKKMVLNSLTGEIALASNVTSFDAASAAISGNTFLSAANDATVRKSGELILRASVSIFKFSVPAQTTSTLPTAISRQISTTTLNSTLPEVLPGTTRYFAFLLNFADDIPTNASSTWTVDLASGSDIQFTFSGQAMTDLKEGIAHMSETFLPPTDNWQLKVNVPSQSNTIRVFNVFLLVFDRVN